MSVQKADELGLTNPNNVQSGIPTAFSQYGDNITLYPTPTVVAPFLMFYTRIPIEVDSNDDIPEIAYQYHNRIVEYCDAKAAELDDDSVESNRKMQQFNQGVDDLKDNEEWLERDFYPHMGVPLADTYGASIFDDC
jgi:hypothetical protein